MKYATEMGSDSMTYIPSFIKIGLDIQKLIGGIHAYGQHSDNTSPLMLFFLNKGSRIKICHFSDLPHLITTLWQRQKAPMVVGDTPHMKILQ
jgi:hypothetical protein